MSLFSACPSAGGSIHCKIVDEQVECVVRALVLPEDWKARITKSISAKSEKIDLEGKRKDLLDRQRRLGKVFTDGIIEESDYQLQRHRITEQLESLTDPIMDTAKEAGLLIENLTELWKGATLEERHRLVRVMFDAVFVDHKIEKSIVCIRPKTAFRPIFQDIKTRKGSGVFLTLMDDEQIAKMQKTPHLEDEGHLCAWWRRGRVELPVQKTLRLEYTTGLSDL